MLQYQTFVFLAEHCGGALRRHIRENWLAARDAASQTEVQNPLRFFVFALPIKRIFGIMKVRSILEVVFFNGRPRQFEATWIERTRAAI